MTTSTSTIDTLLRLVPDSPTTVLNHLTLNPSVASSADSSGYTLLHAASSYNQLTLLRTLVQTYNVNVNITDADGETPLFAAETLEAARCLVEELGADVGVRNKEGGTAEEWMADQMDDGGEFAAIKEYLEERRVHEYGALNSAGDSQPATARPLSVNNMGASGVEDVHPPPPLPPNVRINMGTMQEEPLEGEGAPDPEFRRRIEELAARDDFHGEEAQKELRKLVEDAIGGLETDGGGREVRRRVE